MFSLFLQQKQLLGPGTYNITDFIDHMSRKPGSKRGVCETREARFDTTKLVGSFNFQGFSRIQAITLVSTAMQQVQNRAVETHACILGAD